MQYLNAMKCRFKKKSMVRHIKVAYLNPTEYLPLLNPLINMRKFASSNNSSHAHPSFRQMRLVINIETLMVSIQSLDAPAL